MFTTPLRSLNMPPMPAKTSGVENTNIDAIRSARKTVSRLPVLERVARTPRPIPSRPDATAPHPSRRSPRVIAQSPHESATIPTRIDQTIERASIGGIVSRAATAPRITPSFPTERGPAARPKPRPSTPPTALTASSAASGASSRGRG